MGRTGEWVSKPPGLAKQRGGRNLCPLSAHLHLTMGPFIGRTFRGIYGGHLEERMRNRTLQSPSYSQKTLCSQGHVYLVGRGRKQCIKLFVHSQPMHPCKMTHYRLISDLGKLDPKEPSGISNWHQRTRAPGFVRGRGVSSPLIGSKDR